MKSISPYNEQDYLDFFQAGEERGLAWYFELYYPALVSFAHGYVKHLPAAEDIAGEAFVKLWQRRTTFDSPYGIRAFLYVIVRNASISYIRQHKKITEHQKELAFTSPIQEGNILQHLVHTEKLSEVYNAISALPPGCGEVVRMMYIEGKNYKEIASELNLSINTIRNHRSRAIMLLKKRLLHLLIFVCFFS
ncbi:MAG: RNA polymerase sigma-70 factor [Nitrosopumilus sp.]|jgi:RNA polymerase sigma-70 factor (ECF subfamily)|nr:RNA polymerase sigma-70 factor [Nitrosopumilus sp.]